MTEVLETYMRSMIAHRLQLMASKLNANANKMMKRGVEDLIIV